MAYMNRSGVRGRAHRRSGHATVEMAIVLVLLLWLVFGVLEYGWMLIKAQEINGIARHGARIALSDSGKHEEVEAAIASSMGNAGMGGSYVLETAPADLNMLESGETFTVTLRLSYGADGGVSLRLPVPRPGWIQASVTMTKEGT